MNPAIRKKMAFLKGDLGDRPVPYLTNELYSEFSNASVCPASFKANQSS
jgi:hypothetical protein